MRKTVWILLAAALFLSVSACQQKTSGQERPIKPEESEEQLSLPLPEEFSREISMEEISRHTPVPEISLPGPGESSQASVPVDLVLPEGVRTTAQGKLRFSTSVLSLNVTFPDEFCIQNKDYLPKYGIYLQNMAGTATLLLESVEDKTMTSKQMSDYLKQKYPDASIFTNDKRDIIFKLNTMDSSGSPYCLMQKIRMKSGGYNQILLCCRPSEKSAYAKIFNEINFS